MFVDMKLKKLHLNLLMLKNLEAHKSLIVQLLTQKLVTLLRVTNVYGEPDISSKNSASEIAVPYREIRLRDAVLQLEGTGAGYWCCKSKSI